MTHKHVQCNKQGNTIQLHPKQLTHSSKKNELYIIYMDMYMYIPQVGL